LGGQDQLRGRLPERRDEGAKDKQQHHNSTQFKRHNNCRASAETRSRLIKIINQSTTASQLSAEDTAPRPSS
jgi:hypothetical protein